MSTKTSAHVVVGLAWALLSSTCLLTTDAQAQTAQGQKDAPPSTKAESKPESSPPTTPDSSNANKAPDGKEPTSGVVDPAQNDPQSPGTAADATGATSEPAPSQEAPADTPPPDSTDVGGAEVTTGSGLFEQSQSAASASTTNGEGSDSPQTPAFELGGYVRGDMYVGKDPDSSQGQLKAGYGEMALKFRAQKEQYGDAYAELRVRDGLQGSSQNLLLDLREAYVNGYFGPLDLRLGKQIVVWGRADAFNPTNNLTPNDLRVRSPIEDDRRVGNLGARAFLNFAPFRLEGVWMPLYVASELPSYKLPEAVYFGDTRYPKPNVDNGLVAGRLHLELSAIEMSASFLHGYAPLPGLTRESYTWGVTPTTILISRTAYQHNVAGFDFSTAIGDLLGVRGEIAYRRPVDYKTRLYAPHPDLQYVLGIDHTFGSVSVIAQYLGRYIFDWQKENGPEDPVGPEYLAGLTLMTSTIESQVNTQIDSTLRQKNQIIFGQTAKIQHLSSVRIEWLTLDETLSLSALGLVNFTTHEWLAYPKIGYRISDRISTSIGAEIYMGPENTLFGMIKETLSAGYTELRYAF